LNSHLLSETERVCDRIGILAYGQVLKEGKLDELTCSQTRWRVRVAPGANGEALVAAGFVNAGSVDRWRCEAADPAELNALLDRARSTGAALIELSRDEKELEDVLADALGASRPAGAA
jgi:ABC-2 type transport system ATP-binding protein